MTPDLGLPMGVVSGSGEESLKPRIHNPDLHAVYCRICIWYFSQKSKLPEVQKLILTFHTTNIVNKPPDPELRNPFSENLP